MEKDVAIDIKNVRKKYKLGQIGGQSLQAGLQSWWARKRGKEDPNSKIGTDQRTYGQTFWALNGINIKIKKGEAVGIIGRNGAGKSTLLKLLSRVTSPTEGEIDICGRITSMLEVGTGFHPEMTGRENVYMNGAILGMTKAEIDSKMDQIIEFSEIGEFIDTPVKRYSSGMYVKLAFSVAAHLDSEIMIMDEVLAVGDMAFQKKCLRKMRDAATVQGKTVLYVSHNMNTIRELCDRCIVLREGKVIFDGEVERAISVYLGIGKNRSETINVTKEMHETSIKDSTVILTKIESEAHNNIIDYGKGVNFSFGIQNQTGTEQNVYLRLVLKAMDGSIVTMASSKHSILLREKELITKKYYFDITNVVPGEYNITFVLYNVGELGNNRNQDVLRDIYSLTIAPIPEFNHGMFWNPKWWGYVASPEMEDIF